MKTITVSLVRAGIICLGVFAMVALAIADDDCLKKVPKLRIGVHTLDLVDKQPVCVKPNGNFSIQLIALDGYTIDRKNIKVKAKRGFKKIEDVILDSDNRLHIEVGDFDTDTDQEYLIKITGVGVLDPRVRINTNAFALTSEMQALDVYAMNNYDISLLELMDLDQHFQDEYHTNISDAVRMLKATSESTSD